MGPGSVGKKSEAWGERVRVLLGTGQSHVGNKGPGIQLWKLVHIIHSNALVFHGREQPLLSWVESPESVPILFEPRLLLSVPNSPRICS